MVGCLFEALLQVLVVAPFIVLWTRADGRAKLIPVGVLAACYLPYHLIENLPKLYGCFNFIGGGWNWDGKILGTLWGVACYFLFRSFFDGHDYFTFRQYREGRGKALAAAVMIVVLSALVWFVLGDSDFDWETLAFQLTIPGIDEEILFRGVLLGFLMATLQSKVRFIGNPSVLLTAVLFGLLHAFSVSKEGSVSFSLPYFLQTGFAGYVWAWVTVKSRSIVLAVLSHNFSNFLGTLATMIK